MYQQTGEKWWPDREFEKRVIRPMQERSRVHGLWEDAISEWPENREKRFILDELFEGAKLINDKPTQADKNKAGKLLRSLGCKSQKSGSARYFMPPA